MERLKWWFYWQVLNHLFDEERLPNGIRVKIYQLIKLTYELMNES